MSQAAVTVIVSAALLDDDGRLLSGRRSAPPRLAGRWELPGGKVEAGESDEQALLREVREELGVESEIVLRLPGDWALGPRYVMKVFITRITSGEPLPLEDHDMLRWLDFGDWRSVHWLDADLPILDALEEQWLKLRGRSQASEE
jgi:8-oxo-dGTP diphosphatase